jgi:selenocysteine lyase/cysteine desulfurase
MELRDREGITVEAERGYTLQLQEEFLAGLEDRAGLPLHRSMLAVPDDPMQRGRFLAFHTEQAQVLAHALHDRNVIADARGDMLRFGFGLYQESEDIDKLLKILANL